MVVIGFPVMVKREHFKPMREHITKRMKADTFEQAFHKICSKYPFKYSQFDLMAHYLWFYKRDEYSWHLVNWTQSRHPAFNRLMTEKKEVLEMNRPIQGVMKHGNHHVFSDYIFKLIGDYLCVVGLILILYLLNLDKFLELIYQRRANTRPGVVTDILRMSYSMEPIETYLSIGNSELQAGLIEEWLINQTLQKILGVFRETPIMIRIILT